jgi:hypothetical protein
MCDILSGRQAGNNIEFSNKEEVGQWGGHFIRFRIGLGLDVEKMGGVDCMHRGGGLKAALLDAHSITFLEG